MLIAMTVCFTLAALGLLGLVGFAVHRIYVVAEHALLLARAKDATEYANALEQQALTGVAKVTPKQDNASSTRVVQFPDGTVREVEAVYVND